MVIDNLPGTYTHNTIWSTFSSFVQPNSTPMKVIITGASGVLGTAVRKAFTAKPDTEILALSNSRTGSGLVSLDITDNEAVDVKFREFKPDWIVHCAAERRPDVAEKNPEATRRLNAGVPAHLASLAKSIGSYIVYISTGRYSLNIRAYTTLGCPVHPATDYVFDGTSPPYKPSAPTNPLNLYGQTKRDGEQAVLCIDNAKAIVLRVPVLYGPAPKNSDSAVNILLDVVQDQSGKQYNMDHYATRYPTNVEDIAGFLVRLSNLPPAQPIPSILHYSAAEPFTKYEICLTFAKILGLPHGHIIPDAEPPKGASAANRPWDCHLDTTETEYLGVEDGLGLSLFEEWWSAHLEK
ncbi:NAD(P)-binding protein [Marasmius fiardii PR-910]|nr:NAD(P)-binding protein [Marasmius fiardii PR-910]